MRTAREDSDQLRRAAHVISRRHCGPGLPTARLDGARAHRTPIGTSAFVSESPGWIRLQFGYYIDQLLVATIQGSRAGRGVVRYLLRSAGRS